MAHTRLDNTSPGALLKKSPVLVKRTRLIIYARYTTCLHIRANKLVEYASRLRRDSRQNLLYFQLCSSEVIFNSTYSHRLAPTAGSLIAFMYYLLSSSQPLYYINIAHIILRFFFMCKVLNSVFEIFVYNRCNSCTSKRSNYKYPETCKRG